jgi:hypothetical protein
MTLDLPTCERQYGYFLLPLQAGLASLRVRARCRNTEDDGNDENDDMEKSAEKSPTNPCRRHITEPERDTRTYFSYMHR